MLFNVGYILVVSFGLALLMSHGLSQRDTGFEISLVSWTLVATIPPGDVLIDRIGHPTTVMMASFAVFGLGTLLVPIAPSLTLMTFVGAVAGLPAGTIMVLPAEVVRPPNRAAGMGVFFTWYYAGMALLTPVGAFSGTPAACTAHPCSLPAACSLRRWLFWPCYGYRSADSGLCLKIAVAHM